MRCIACSCEVVERLRGCAVLCWVVYLSTTTILLILPQLRSNTNAISKTIRAYLISPTIIWSRFDVGLFKVSICSPKKNTSLMHAYLIPIVELLTPRLSRPLVSKRPHADIALIFSLGLLPPRLLVTGTATASCLPWIWLRGSRAGPEERPQDSSSISNRRRKQPKRTAHKPCRGACEQIRPAPARIRIRIPFHGYQDQSGARREINVAEGLVLVTGGQLATRLGRKYVSEEVRGQRAVLDVGVGRVEFREFIVYPLAHFLLKSRSSGEGGADGAAVKEADVEVYVCRL